MYDALAVGEIGEVLLTVSGSPVCCDSIIDNTSFCKQHVFFVQLVALWFWFLFLFLFLLLYFFVVHPKRYWRILALVMRTVASAHSIHVCGFTDACATRGLCATFMYRHKIGGTSYIVKL